MFKPQQQQAAPAPQIQTIIKEVPVPGPTITAQPARANPAYAALNFLGLRRSTRPELSTRFSTPGAGQPTGPGRKSFTEKRTLIGGDM